MPIKTYNTHLNASYDATLAFKRWSDYRQKLHGFMSDHGLLNGTVAIVGAGHLNDFDLLGVHSEGSELILMDCDLKAMENGVERQGYKGNVIYREVDLTGLDDVEFFDELSVLLTEKDVQGVIRYLQSVKCTPQLALEKESIDVLVVTPIYTQLVLQQFLDLVVMTGNQDAYEELTEAVLQFMVRLIESVNEALLEGLKKGGLLVAWSDIMEYVTDHPDYLELLSTPTAPEDIKACIDRYESHYGMGVGAFGLQDLLDKCQPTDMKEGYFIWPFEEERHLLVKGAVGRKD